MKLKLISIILTIMMLLSSNIICIEDAYAQEETSTGIIAVLAGGNITVAVISFLRNRMHVDTM